MESSAMFFQNYPSTFSVSDKQVLVDLYMGTIDLLNS